jgi:hypothetical protein
LQKLAINAHNVIAKTTGTCSFHFSNNLKHFKFLALPFHKIGALVCPFLPVVDT